MTSTYDAYGGYGYLGLGTARKLLGGVWQWQGVRQEVPRTFPQMATPRSPPKVAVHRKVQESIQRVPHMDQKATREVRRTILQIATGHSCPQAAVRCRTGQEALLEQVPHKHLQAVLDALRVPSSAP